MRNLQHFFFHLALEQNPYDRQTILEYATFLFHKKGDVEKAKQIAEPFHKRQSNYIYINLLLAEIAIAEKDYDLATTYLKSIRSHPKDIKEKYQDLQKQIEKRN